MRVGVVGLGLIGGSLARAIKTGTEPFEVVGADALPSTREAAAAAGAVDRVEADPARVAATCDVVVYATPMGATLDLMTRHHEQWRADSLIMDVASLKRPVQERIVALGKEALWIGAHPMAGGERSGFEASKEELFEGAHVWLTAAIDPHPHGDLAQRFWTSVGAEWRWGRAREHDRQMVMASHLPQLTANALARAMAVAGLGPADLGPGGRDMIRLAGSSPALWRSLVEASGPQLAPVLRALGSDLDSLADALDQGDLDAVEALMKRTRDWKEGRPWT